MPNPPETPPILPFVTVKATEWRAALEAIAAEIAGSGIHERSISLSRTHVQDASNWLTRFLNEEQPDGE
jgi:hypothetical protein